VITSLSGLAVWQSALVMIVLPVVVVMILTYVVRRSVGLDRLGHNNEVAGFKYAVLGVIYAVLLGFAVIVVWENFRDGQAAVMNEASAISTIYRLAEGVDPAAAAIVRLADVRYGETVVTQEASAMAMGQASPAATISLSGLYEAVLAAKPATLEQSDAFQNLLVSLQTLSDARRDRLELAGSTVPEVIWLVLFGGAVLNVAFLLFFGTRHTWVQMVMSGMLTAVIFMALFSIVMIDHPFAGSVRVSMEPIAYVLEHVAQQD
jgi:hypothetical protein